jgi:hypothetical protein
LLHFKADDIIWKSYYRYTSSLVFSGSNFSVSSSRGNVDSFWDIKIQTYYALFHRRHVASIAISSNADDTQLFTAKEAWFIC